MVRPAKPIKAINTFLTIINNFFAPLISLWNVQYSIIAGNIKPNADKHNAPNNDINNSKFGMATASKTGRRQKKNLIKFRSKYNSSSFWLNALFRYDFKSAAR